MLNFFKLENHEVEINKDELYVIPSAKKLVFADKGGIIKGDYDGRNKLMAKKKLAVVWWIVDINSPGVQSGLTGDELIQDAITSLEVPKEWDYKNDMEFQDFLDDYTEMYYSASYHKLLREVLITFEDSAATVRAIRKQTRKILDDKIDLDADDMKSLVAAQNQIIAIATEIPQHIEKLKNLQQIVDKLQKEQTVGRGNVNITSSMIPEK